MSGAHTPASDIFAGQPADADLLAEIYDLEHDEIREDLVFYREMVGRARGAVLDLGCGSGRLLAAFFEGGARRVLGVDGSAALLRRARARIAADPRLRVPAAEGRLVLRRGDVRRLRLRERADLAVCAGVLAHLDGPDDALRMLRAAARGLAPGGLLIVDTLGPGALPTRDLPLSLDWRRSLRGREVVRRSELTRRVAPDGLRVVYSTLTDTPRPDGTIARLPASYRLWYPSPAAIAGLVRDAGLVVEATYGSHDLEPLDETSERCIVVARRGTSPGPLPGRISRVRRGSAG
ncbi:MAG TPA: class I SAM-dependent methyltransferase [Candidatus Limnocylindria bacterium]|nr:class I SAM-dependent methyltransferase [Candidatus Limnocylindria bacterium]